MLLSINNGIIIIIIIDIINSYIYIYIYIYTCIYIYQLKTETCCSLKIEKSKAILPDKGKILKT